MEYVSGGHNKSKLQVQNILDRFPCHYALPPSIHIRSRFNKRRLTHLSWVGSEGGMLGPEAYQHVLYQPGVECHAAAGSVGSDLRTDPRG